MLRTSNKRLHSNLWTIAHFAGSALVFILVISACVGFSFVTVGGAQTTSVNNNTALTAFLGALDELILLEDFETTWVFPVTRLFWEIISFGYDDGVLTTLFYAITVGIDFVLWFNIGLWFLQLLVFIPDACFHWLERKKED